MSEVTARPLLVERAIVVRTYDIDFANIVHNIVYFRWLEDLRSEVLADTLSVEQILESGISPILTRSEIEYHWPVRIGDAVTGRMWVAELSRTRWTLAGEIVVAGKVCAASRQTGYFADLQTLRPVRMPEVLRTKWLAAGGQ